MLTPLIALLCAAHSCVLQPDTLGTAEVTAPRLLQGLNTPTPVQRIDSLSVLTRGITDTGDALRRLSGVNLRDYGGAGGLKTVSVRGLGAGHTAVSYDGLCVSDVRQGQVDIGQYQLDALGSIELHTLDNEQLLCPVHNLASALVSLSSPTVSLSDRRFHGNIGVRHAAFGTWAPSFGLSKRVGERTFLSTAAHYLFARNNYPFVLENGSATIERKRTNSRMQAAGAEINLRQAVKGGSIEGKLFFNHNYRHLPGIVHYYVNENHEVLLEQTAFGQARWQQQWGKWRVMAAVKHGWNTSQYDNRVSGMLSGPASQLYWQRETYLTAGTAWQAARIVSLAYATDYAFASQNSNVATDRRAWRDTWLQALSLQLQTARLRLVARGTFHRYWNGMAQGGSARDAKRLTPTLTASVLLLRHRQTWLYARGGYKELFRLPTFTESYYYHLGSKTLEPELTRQLSVGLTLQTTPAAWWRTLSLTADGYANRVSERIVSIPYNLFVWRTINMGDVRTLGLDVTMQSEWMMGRRHSLLLSANYSLQKSADHTDPSLATWHMQLPYTPLHSGACSLMWQNPWVNPVVHVTFTSERWATSNHLPGTSLGGYEEWGVALYRSLSFKGCTLLLRADMTNVFDKRYFIIARYPMPGRGYSVSASVQF